MNPDDLEALLSGAFDAQARACVPDSTAPPAPRFADPSQPVDLGTVGLPDAVVTTGGAHRAAPVRDLTARRSRRARLLAPLSAAAAVVLAVSIGAVALHAGGDHRPTSAGRSVISSPAVTTASTASTQAAGNVHVKLLNPDHDIYGVGMPVIAYFTRKITDARAFQRATTATANGKPITVAWYFEKSHSGYPYEAHLRPKDYWPANARIHVGIASQGLSGGGDFRFDDSLTLDFRTGAEQIATVQNHELTLTVDGRPTGTYPVSLGAVDTPTTWGTKVIMEQAPTKCLQDQLTAGHCRTVHDVQRLTYDGEFLLAAPWNADNIAAHVDSSDGSVDLAPAAAATLYKRLRVGDVVVFPKSDAPAMKLGKGYGDWMVSWNYWLHHGLVPTR